MEGEKKEGEDQNFSTTLNGHYKYFILYIKLDALFFFFIYYFKFMKILYILFNRKDGRKYESILTDFQLYFCNNNRNITRNRSPRKKIIIIFQIFNYFIY
jgi:hypothetical protein